MSQYEMSKQRVRYYQIMFYSGALFNWSAAILFLAGFEQMYAFMGGDALPQEPIFTLLLQLISSIVILFGFIYYYIGRNPALSSGYQLAITGMLGKLLFVYFFTHYAIAGLTPWGLAYLVFVDFIYALLFFEYARYQSSTIAATSS